MCSTDSGSNVPRSCPRRSAGTSRCERPPPNRIDAVVHLGWTIGAPAGHVPLVMRLVSIGPLGRLMARAPIPDRSVRSMLEQLGLRQALAAGRVPQEFVGWFAAQLRHTDTALNDADASPPMMHPLRGIDEKILFVDELLGSIEVPVHFIWGSDDPFGGADVAADFVPRSPDATLELVDGGGHAVWPDDPETLRSEVREKYRQVAEKPDGDVHFQTGRGLAARCGYDPDVVDALPDIAVESYAGVANPFALRELKSGERVVDVGSGAGFDSFLASDMVGPTAQVGTFGEAEGEEKARKSEGYGYPFLCRRSD